MTFEDISTENMPVNNNHTSPDWAPRCVATVLRRAAEEGRLTCGLMPAVKTLEVDPDSVLLCVLPAATTDPALHIHSVLLHAFCYENDVRILTVDSAENLASVVGGNDPSDYSCVLVHQSKQQNNNDSEEAQLLEYCDADPDYDLPVIQLPV